MILKSNRTIIKWTNPNNKSCLIGLLLLSSNGEKNRILFFYKDHFREFYARQPTKVKNRILWTLKIIEEIDRIPEVYFKHLENTDSLYEIRVQSSGNIFRIFCFFDQNNIVVVGHGFQKKTQKTPPKEIDRAEIIKREYYEEKKSHKS